MSAFMHIVGLSRDSFGKIVLIAEYEEDPEDKHMHCSARLVDMLNSYAYDLQNSAESDATKDFLLEEINVLQEAKWIGLPNFIPRTSFITILQRKVKGIADMPFNFVDNVWNYLETVLLSVLNRHSSNYYQLQVSIRRAGETLIAKRKKNSRDHVKGAVEMEKLTDYTCNPVYLQVYDKLISLQDAFLKEVFNQKTKPARVTLAGVGEINVVHLSNYPQTTLCQAFDLKARIIAYWKIVLRRLIDSIALHLMLSINELVNIDLQKGICNDLLSSVGGEIERLLEESPSIAGKRLKLKTSVEVLKESKDTVANIMDRICVCGDI